MGRPPCCDKVGIKKGPWTPEEDIILVSYIQEHGPGNWRAVPTNTGLMRCSKSCRLRWTNYLRPGIKRGNFTPHEEGMIIHLQALLGNKWAAIATYLPQRTDNDIKNYWNTHLKKKLKKLHHHQSIASGFDQPHHQMASSSSDHSNNNYHQFMSRGYGERVNNANIENPSVYASSAENISRLLEGWMRSSVSPSSPPLANNITTSNHLMINENRDNSLYGDLGTGFATSPVGHHGLEGILSFDHQHQQQQRCEKSSCDSSQKGSRLESNSIDQENKVDFESIKNQQKEIDIDNINHNPPLSFLEKWLLDESAGQVMEELPSMF